MTTLDESIAVALNYEDARGRDQVGLRRQVLNLNTQEGRVFREFMLEEVVTVVDASSRQAVQELMRRVGLNNLPMPSLFRALNPTLSGEDRRVSPFIHLSSRLTGFLFRISDSQ